jgi:pilus assembly protein Flp/PilA
MSNLLQSKFGLRTRRGQTTAEYAIILAIVAIASIAVILVFGNQIRELFFASSKNLTPGGAGTQTKDVSTGQEGKTTKTGTGEF